MLSTVVYESRERVPSPRASCPPARPGPVRAAGAHVPPDAADEEEHQVELSRSLDAGFATPVFHWAEGKPLRTSSRRPRWRPGDFVRNCRRLIDLLHQIEDVAEGETAAQFRRARGAVMHGVVAYTGV